MSDPPPTLQASARRVASGHEPRAGTLRAIFRAIKRSEAIIALFFSIAALALSAAAFYKEYLSGPDINFYVGRYIDLAHANITGKENFVVPLTVTNTGGSTGTVLHAILDIYNLKTKRVKKFESIYVFERHEMKERFAPMAIGPGNSRHQAVGFYPTERKESYIVEGAGDFRIVMAQLPLAVEAGCRRG